MSYIVRVFLEDRIWNLDLETFDSITVGSGPQDTITVRELDESQIRIIKKQTGEYLISGLFLSRIEEGMSAPVSADLLEEDNLYRVNGGKTLELTVHPKQKNSTDVILLSNFERLQIGRNRTKNDIVLLNKRTSSVHCEIVKTGDAYVLRDLNSTNGTYLNNRLIVPGEEEKLYDGDVICLSIYRLYFLGEKLYLFNTGDDLQLNVRSVQLSDTEEKSNIYSLFCSQDEPGLMHGTIVPEDRTVMDRSIGAENNEETLIGSEQEIERMLEEERKEKKQESETKESESVEETQVGSEPEIEKMLQEERSEKH